MNRIKLLAVFFILFSGCAGPVKDLYPPEPDAPDARIIHVTGHGWHTGIVLKREDAVQYLPLLKNEFPFAAYIEIGWGDEGFYMAEKITPWLVLKALLWPTKSVLHVVWLPFHPEEYFPDSELMEIKLSHKGFVSLAAYINDSFQSDENHQAVYMGKGIYGVSRFYSAKRYYHGFNTCNIWTAEAVRASGFPISPFYALTAGNVVSQIKSRSEKKGH